MARPGIPDEGALTKGLRMKRQPFREIDSDHRARAVSGFNLVRESAQTMFGNHVEKTMKVLIGYATSDGQTRKISRRIADHLVDNGHSIELAQLKDIEGIDLGRFDGVIIAASIHAGHYQAALSDFAESKASELRRVPSLFLSVSLAAAGHDADDWRSLEQILDDFEAASAWTPGRVEQVAGAYRPSQYDIFRRFIMRRIIAAKDPGADLAEDKEYTDWPVLFTAVTNWLTSLDSRDS